MPEGVNERYWNECKESVKKSHPDLDTDSTRFYKLVMGCVKNREGGNKEGHSSYND